MGYTLRPTNESVVPYQFGAFSFPILLEACGYLFGCIHSGPRWRCLGSDADERLWGDHPDGSDTPYPAILGGGFYVTNDEALIMARIAGNFAAMQRILPEENRSKGIRGQVSFKKQDMLELVSRAMYNTEPGPWPEKIRDDFTEKIERFAAWALTSGGFMIEFEMTVGVEEEDGTVTHHKVSK